MKLFSAIFALFLIMATTLSAQTTRDPKTTQLLGRWQVIKYAEQGFPVDKTQNSLTQAQDVYGYIKLDRTKMFYGYDPEMDELSRRATRRYQEWVIEDSTREVKRIAKAIEMPYFVVFFPDSTVSMYNKETDTGHIYFPKAKRYVFSPSTMSIDMKPAPIDVPMDKWEIQVLLLTDDRMVLFLPEQASIVELRKTSLIIP
jgi:hypothetical protein